LILLSKGFIAERAHVFLDFVVNDVDVLLQIGITVEFGSARFTNVAEFVVLVVMLRERWRNESILNVSESHISYHRQLVLREEHSTADLALKLFGCCNVFANSTRAVTDEMRSQIRFGGKHSIAAATNKLCLLAVMVDSMKRKASFRCVLLVWAVFARKLFNLQVNRPHVSRNVCFAERFKAAQITIEVIRSAALVRMLSLNVRLELAQ